jgi:hypothetical protein
MRGCEKVTREGKVETTTLERDDKTGRDGMLEGSYRGHQLLDAWGGGVGSRGGGEGGGLSGALSPNASSNDVNVAIGGRVVTSSPVSLSVWRGGDLEAGDRPDALRLLGTPPAETDFCIASETREGLTGTGQASPV